MHQPALVTERLHLRPVESKDQQKVFEGFSNPQVLKHLTVSYPTFEATAEQMAWYANNRETGTGYAWAVCKKGEPDLMGVFSIYYLNKEHRRCELGYWLLPDYWGLGYTAEGIAAITHHAFSNLNIHRIAAEIEPENTASWRMLQKLGFEKDGT